MNIIMDDTLIFDEEDEQENHPQVKQSSVISRSAQWLIRQGSKLFNRRAGQRNTHIYACECQLNR